MDAKTIANYISWALLAIQFVVVVWSVRSTPRFSKRLLKYSKERYTIFIKQQGEMLDKFKQAITNRINLLSKENAKLREENEKLRDKLKNLGFSDVTLDN